jgi:hypothetical protein
MAHPRDYAPLGWQIRDRVEPEGREPTRDEAIDYLTLDGPRLPCFSLYGSTAADCARAAWQLASAISQGTGEPLTFEQIDESVQAILDEGDDAPSIAREREYA